MDSLTWHVMDALADDWESIAQIRPHVHEFVGLASDAQIFATLRRLQEARLVEIVPVANQPADIFESEPAACWFGMTEAGRKAWDSDGAKYRGDEKT
jgi:hypothetical protein